MMDTMVALLLLMLHTLSSQRASSVDLPKNVTNVRGRTMSSRQSGPDGIVEYSVESKQMDYEDWLAVNTTEMVDQRSEIMTLMPTCTKDHPAKVTAPCLRRDFDSVFPYDASSMKLYSEGKFTKRQQEAINSLASGEVILMGDVMFERVVPGDHESGHRRTQATKCTGVLSATCDNYGWRNVDYDTYIKHYPPNGGTPTDGWEEYTQLVYSLDFQELHRVWYKCASTSVSRKKRLYANHGLSPFQKQASQRSKIWVRRQAICCLPQTCSFSDW
jgi:hypothetical protein